MILVCDTGPLIALAKIRQLDLFKQLEFQSVCVPVRVHHELWGKIGPESAAIEAALATLIRVAEAPLPLEPLRSALAGLDPGEREVLGLAASLGRSTLVLLDDHAGRAVARKLGLRITGTVGLLLLAKKRGLVSRVLPLLQEARDNGYWLSDALLAEAGKLAGE